MKENMNSSFGKLPEGSYEWEIFDVSDLQQKARSVQRTWKLNTVVDGNIEQVWFYMRPFEYKVILIALGYKTDDAGNIDWEIDDVKGKKIAGVLSYRQFNGKDYPMLSMIKPCDNASIGEEIPF